MSFIRNGISNESPSQGQGVFTYGPQIHHFEVLNVENFSHGNEWETKP